MAFSAMPLARSSHSDGKEYMSRSPTTAHVATCGARTWPWRSHRLAGSSAKQAGGGVPNPTRHDGIRGR